MFTFDANLFKQRTVTLGVVAPDFGVVAPDFGVFAPNLSSFSPLLGVGAVTIHGCWCLLGVGVFLEHS